MQPSQDEDDNCTVMSFFHSARPTWVSVPCNMSEARHLLCKTNPSPDNINSAISRRHVMVGLYCKWKWVLWKSSCYKVVDMPHALTTAEINVKEVRQQCHIFLSVW